jgi:hypothetical protein
MAAARNGADGHKQEQGDAQVLGDERLHEHESSICCL